MTHPIATLIAGVKVKPLEWNNEYRPVASPEPYQIWPDNGASGAPDDPLETFDGFMLYSPHMMALGIYSTVEAAKVAAQADYEARILAALEAVQPPDLVEAGKVIERIEKADPFAFPFSAADAELAAADTLRALIALCQAQQAQIATKQARIDTLHDALDAEEKRAEAAEAKVAELEAQVVAEKEENRWAYIQAAMDDRQTDAEAEAATLRAEVERLRGALEKINVGEGWAAKIARAAWEGKHE